MTSPGPADLSRYDDLIAWLRDFARTDPDAVAAWVGGSAVTGGYDDWSDLDAELLSSPGCYVAVFDRLVAGYRERFGPSGVWQIPVSVDPGARQIISAIDAEPGSLEAPTRIFDIVVRDCDDDARRVDVRRHGAPLVLHDPGGVVELGPEPADRQRREIEEALGQIRQRREVGRWLVNRAIDRGHLPEALSLYVRFALTPVVQLLRIRDCPDRHDYGLRYLHTDLAEEDAARVVQLLPGSDRLRELSDACFAWQDALLTYPGR